MPSLTKGAQVVVEDARHAIFGVWMGVDCGGKEEGVIGLVNREFLSLVLCVFGTYFLWSASSLTG
jgi:hypothetical protein